MILVEFAFAFPTCGSKEEKVRGSPSPAQLTPPYLTLPALSLTQEDDDAHGTQDPSTNETTDPEAVPV